MFIKPKEGLQIYDPFRKDRLPSEGRDVPDGDLYWQIILRDGDVFLATPPVDPPKTIIGGSK